MYAYFQSPAVHSAQTPSPTLPWQRVSRTVLFLGLTSMFTDISSEMVTSIIPLYLTLGLGLSPLQFGVFEGFYQGVTAFLRVGAGVVTDRSNRHKGVASIGYAVSAVSRIGLFAAGTASGAFAWLLTDRGGKSIRTPARDALIALNSQPDARAEAFGVHRALDALGALLGPVAAFAVLALVPDGFDVIFLVSFCFALLGLAVLLLFVEPSHTARRPGFREPDGRRSTSRAVELFRVPDFRAVLVVGGLLSAMTISDAFIYLTFHQQSGLSSALFPLLYVGTALTYLVLAVPVGRWADRFGRRRVFVAGHALLLLLYAVLLAPHPGVGGLVVCLVLLGAYYAATDGVLMAVTSSVVPGALLASGLAFVTTATVAARFGGSVLFGALWTWYGAPLAVIVFLTGLALTIAVGASLLGRATGQTR